MVQPPIVQSVFSQSLFAVGDVDISVGATMVGFAGLMVVLLVAIIVIIARGGRKRADAAEAQALRARELEQRLHDMAQAQAEASGRAQALGEALAGRQA